MRVRAIYYLFLYTFVMAVFSWFFMNFLGNKIYELTLLSQVAVIAIGLTAGAVLGVAVAAKELRLLAEKGTHQISLLPYLFIVIAFLILAVLNSYGFVHHFITPSALVIENVVAEIIWLAVPTLSAAKAILYVLWERKHKRIIIYPDLSFTELAVYPSMNEAPT
jgi:hypothetical protein